MIQQRLVGASQLAVGLGFKLLLAPLLLTILYLGLLGQSGTVTRVTLFEAAMGPQIGGAIVATQYGLDPPLVTLMVGVGSIAAFLTLPMWWYLHASVTQQPLMIANDEPAKLPAAHV